jgi:ATP-dependent DNA helicase RecQ
MLRGIDDERTRRFGFTELSTFGLLRGRTQRWVMHLLRGLLAAGWIDLTPTEHPVPLVTAAGGDVMRAHGPVRFALPASASPASPGRGRSMDPTSPAPPRRGTSAPRGASPVLESLDASARHLFDRLRSHRAQVARARGVPAYVVAFDRTLVEMATRAPRSHAELLDVFGMGPARVEAYGDGFLEILAKSP